MKTIQYKWHIIAFNLIALLIFLPLVLPQTINNPFTLSEQTYNQANMGLIASYDFRMAGRWAIRFLIISLAISPLVYLMGWRKIVPLRKWAGLWAFAFAGLHLFYFFNDVAWRKIWGQNFAWVGVFAMVILTALTLTSHKPAMRLLGRNWKRLHRLVYIVGVLVVLHSINGIIHWQKLPDYTIALTEMQIYGLIIGVLLMLRIPIVRHQVRALLKLPKQKHQKLKSTA